MRPLAIDPEDCGEEAHLLRRSIPTESVDGIGTFRVIDAERIVRVALNPDDELRNLQVALLYSMSSARLNKRLMHGLPEDAKDVRINANWFTVAQWAVLTVGRNLRTRDVPHRTSALPSSIRRRLTPAILSLRSSDDRRVAAALSYGQVMVFASIYRALLRSEFNDTAPFGGGDEDGHEDDGHEDDGHGPAPEADAPIGEQPEPDGGVPISAGPVDIAGLAAMVDSFVAEKRQAEEDAAKTDRAQREVVKRLAIQLGATVERIDLDQDRAGFYEEMLAAIAAPAGYEDELAKAFELYRQAARWSPEQLVAEPERSPADLIFEANMRITAVEQVILDGAVTMVVDHLPRHVTKQAEGRLATFAERSLRVPRLIAQVNASRRLSLVAAVAQDAWARVMTDQVMVIALPAETIRLGRDIPHRDWTKPFCAPDLLELSPSAAALFDQFDRSLGDGRGAGAGDWRRFDDRMNFATNLIRSRQQDATLFWQPFTDEDVARVWNGQYPSRIADPFEQAVRSPSFPTDLDGGDLDTESCGEHPPVPPPPPGGIPLHLEEGPA